MAGIFSRHGRQCFRGAPDRCTCQVASSAQRFAKRCSLLYNIRDFDIKNMIMKIIAAAIALSFITVAFLGYFTMKTGMDGKMQNCPLLGQSSEACPMTVAEHLSRWQQLFLATFQSNAISRLLLFLAAVAFAVLKFLRPSRPLSVSIRSFSQNRPPPFESNYLLKAFTEGTIRKRE